MGTVTVLPMNARVLNNVREEVGHLARRYGRTDKQRRTAFMHAFDLIDKGSSSAWAIQAARQDLRDTRIPVGNGGSAA